MTNAIVGWLDQAGFAKHTSAFVDNDIDLDILDLLTKDDLEKIGISLGDRLRLIRAIESGAIASPATKPTLSPPEIASTSGAERRPLTVMFCDLADSTALSNALDPEDMQDVIRAYQEATAEIVRNYEGYVAKYMGDGILIYFGYPKSLERNAARAVQSGLDILDAMVSLNASLGSEKAVKISVRLGIATGTVMVGEIVGEGMAQERTVIGEAPNLAARLQGLAGRNEIVIGSLTKEVSGNDFTYRDFGVHELKGISEATQTWIVTGMRGEEQTKGSVDDHDVITSSPLVGRDEEIGLLRRAWQSTKGESRGQVVTLTGEAGIGKSSLIDGLKSEVGSEGWPLLTMRCSPYHTNSALYPVVEHFKRLARWQATDDAAVRLEKIENMLDRYAQPNAETVPLMAAFLSTSVPEDRYPRLALSPQHIKQQTQDMIVGITMEVAERGAFLHIWEDLHWADPSTLELIGLLIDQAPTDGLLMALTSRPDFVPPWPMRSHITPITLNRLERTHTVALVARTAGEKALPDEVIDHIVTKTDGVPLYVEELTKTIVGSGILRDAGDTFELSGPLASLSIPDTLQESLMSRLDRLPKERELAQLASVLGREFAYEMISGLSDLDDAALSNGLGQLVDDELLYQRGRPPRAKYIFKHALVQDAAYASLLRRPRQETHRRVANLLEAGFPDLVENQPELLAHHYEEAGNTALAIGYLRKAGENSQSKSANVEAISYLSRGLELIGQMTDSSDQLQQEVSMLLAIAPALVATRGYAAPEVEPAYLRALELSEMLGETEKQFTVILGLSMFHFIRADTAKALQLAKQAADLAESVPTPGFDLAAARQLGLVLCLRGEFAASRSHLELVAKNYDMEVHGVFAFQRGGSDFGVGATVTLGWTLQALGYNEQANKCCAQALEIAQYIDHPISLAFAQWGYTHHYSNVGDHKAFLKHAVITEAIAEEKGFPQYVAWTTGQRGEVLLQQCAYGEAIVKLKKAIDANRAIGGRLFDCGLKASLALAYGLNSQIKQGFAMIAEALEHMEETGERYSASKAHLIKGRLFLLGDNANPSEAETCFLEAIKIAQSQNARMWELRAATQLAALWRDQGRIDDARGLLLSVYDWFTEGFETIDLKNARALLDQLN